MQGIAHRFRFEKLPDGANLHELGRSFFTSSICSKSSTAFGSRSAKRFSNLLENPCAARKA